MQITHRRGLAKEDAQAAERAAERVAEVEVAERDVAAMAAEEAVPVAAVEVQLVPQEMEVGEAAEAAAHASGEAPRTGSKWTS